MHHDAPVAVEQRLPHWGHDIHCTCSECATVTVRPALAPEPRPEPDFAGFTAALREEAAWSARIHRGDRTGQAVSDQAALRRLADEVEHVGRALGFCR